MKEEIKMTSKYCIIELPNPLDEEEQFLKGRLFVTDHYSHGKVRVTQYNPENVVKNRFDIFCLKSNIGQNITGKIDTKTDEPLLIKQDDNIPDDQEGVEKDKNLLSQDDGSLMQSTADVEIVADNNIKIDSVSSTGCSDSVQLTENKSALIKTDGAISDMKHITKLVGDASAALTPTGIFPKKIKRKRSKSKKTKQVKTPIDYSYDVRRNVDEEDNDRYYTLHNKTAKNKGSFKIITDKHAGQDKIINAIASIIVMVVLSAIMVIFALITIKYGRMLFVATSISLAK